MDLMLRLFHTIVYITPDVYFHGWSRKEEKKPKEQERKKGINTKRNGRFLFLFSLSMGLEWVDRWEGGRICILCVTRDGS